MKVSQKIEKQLMQIPDGLIFRYQDMGIESNEYGAAAKSIGRLIAEGTVKRASKGLFYKPKQSVFGLMPPSDSDIIKQYLFKNGQRTAYITGTSLYNGMGLTTQIPFTIVVATKTRRSQIVIGKVKIKPVRSCVDVTNDNYKLLGMLDALRDFKIIQDINRTSAIIVLRSKLKELTSAEIRDMIQYSLNYPPRTRALLGAILETMDDSLDLIVLRKNFSPLSQYIMGITPKMLPNALKWNIK
jgi:Family of unknown function (DUF6088)